MPERVFFTTTPYRWQPWEGTPYIEAVTELFHRRPQEDFVLVNTPAEADLILFFEPNYFKDKSYAQMLLQQEAIRAYPNRCFVVNYDDVPIGFLPGVYVSIQRPHMDYQRFRSCCYMGEPNPYCAEAAASAEAVAPRLLFSFRGGRSHPVRGPIFDLAKRPDLPAVIEETFGWYNHSGEQQRIYVQEMLDSKFVLCPRGIGVSSHRLFETMQLGRVPVILSDDWVPPEGPAWLDCSLRIAESNAAAIPDLLGAREKDAREMGRLARQEWEKWFSPEARVHTVLKSIRELKNLQNRDERERQALWLQDCFYTPYGLDFTQRLTRRIKDGSLVEPIKRRLNRLFSKPNPAS